MEAGGSLTRGHCCEASFLPLAHPINGWQCIRLGHGSLDEVEEMKEFDVVVWGATGFTGRLVAEYLAETYVPRWISCLGSGWPKRGEAPIRGRGVRISPRSASRRRQHG